MIYLDNAATTPLDPDVLEVMLPYLRDVYGNPSSVHAAGRSARAAVERAREQVAALAGAHPSEVIFTCGGTEADNFAFHIAAAHDVRRTVWLVGASEHHAVLAPAARRAVMGETVLHLPVDPNGCVGIDTVRAAVHADVALISLMHVNNETGAVQDIAAMSRIAHEAGALFHTDAVQSAGKLHIDMQAMDLDMVSVSAHKMHGPKGVGALLVRRGIEVEPLLVGGAQERGRRGGTESVAQIVGFGAAAKKALRARDERRERWLLLRGSFLDRVRREHPAVVVNGDGVVVQPGILSISFPFMHFGIDGEALLMRMDLDGIALSSGSACTAGSVEPSHVMRAIGHDDATARATLRVSFGVQTTEQDVNEAAATLVRHVTEMRQ
jgi:cysteine desulfurase